jgi:membrane protease YdiL (CAAX protease family)
VSRARATSPAVSGARTTPGVEEAEDASVDARAPREPRGPRAPRERGAVDTSDSAPPLNLQRGIALGTLAMLPLFVIYEAAISANGGSARNAAELVLSLPLAPFSSGGAHVDAVRRIVLVVCALAAAWSCFHAQLALSARILRVAVEGALAAILLGPLLIGLEHLLGVPVIAPLAGALPRVPPPLALAALHMGGAAYEEIVFRVGLQGLLFLLARELVLFFTDSPLLARWLGEAFALVLAGVLFAAAHLTAFSAALGPGGEAFDATIFTWRALAGMLLGALFRWRGPGVSAWTHALFNLALFIGAGPDVFL